MRPAGLLFTALLFICIACAAADSQAPSAAFGASASAGMAPKAPAAPAAAVSLEEAEARALARSTELAILRLRTRAQARTWTLGIREYLPRLSVAFDDARTIVMGGPDSRTKSLALTIEQPLFDGGRVAARRALARAGLLLDGRASADGEDALVDRVRGLYWQALVQREKLAIQEEIRAITGRQLEISRTEMRIGAIREIDLVEAELEEARAALTIGDTRALLEERLDQLKECLGMGPEELLALSGRIDAGYRGLELPGDPQVLIAVALGNNTAVKRQELEAQKALEELRAARREFVPRISLAVTASISGERYPLQDPSITGELVFDFPGRAFPLSASLSAGRTGRKERSAGSGAEAAVLEDLGGWTDRAAAALAREESLLRKEQTVEGLCSQVRRALAACAQKKAAAALQKRTVALAEKRVAILGRQLDLGEIKRVDYMAAQTQLARDASALLESVLAVLEGERELERLLGVRAGELAVLARRWEKGAGE